MKDRARKRITETLAKSHACYILITCDEPSEDGKISVEMSYEGDLSLAAVLLQNAQSIIGEENLEMEPLPQTNKIHYID